MTRRPHFIVLGQGKAGTSFIYRVLGEHSNIGLSDKKELHYFSQKQNKSADWYASRFAHVPQDTALIGEVSPSYLRRDAVEAIARTLGRDTKVIFILRRPIERAYSRYLQDICATQDGQPFKQLSAKRLLKQLDSVIDSIQACYDLFGEKNVLRLFYETDIATPSYAFETKILDFLGLPAANNAERIRAEGVTNPGVMPRYIYTEDDALEVRMGTNHYVIPPQHLVFCGQNRNSAIYPNPTTDQVREAFLRQSRWSGSVSIDNYKMLLKHAVEPAAKKLQTAFGYDMDHWRVASHRIIYDPAPPPKQLSRSKT